MATVTRYGYNPDNKVYIGEVIAHDTPIDPGVFIEPYSSTPIKPPTIPAKQAAIFDEVNNTWSLVDDYRGEIWYKIRDQVLIDGLGDPKTLGLTEEPAAMPAPPDPDRCSKLGLKRALDARGIWSQVRDAINSDPDTKEEWELAVIIVRTDPLVVKIQTAFKLSDDDVTAIIKQAITLAG